MDRVAIDFRTRVAALWRCCETECGSHLPGCIDERVPDCEWTMKSKMKKELISFFIGHDNGEWKYFFTNPDRTRGAKELLSMDELKKNPNLKHVRIGKIDVNEAGRMSMSSLRSPADIERLINFVIFLSNEPRLQLYTWNVQVFDSPEGAILLNYLSKMTFSSIGALHSSPVYNQILENQFTRRKPTAICCWGSILPNSEFLIEHVGNGNIKRFGGPSDFRFPTEVMERIINRFLENPEIHVKNKFYIKLKFEESAKEILERKLAEGSCEKAVDWYDGSTEYLFKVNNPNLEKNSCMRITYGSHLSDSRIAISIC